MQCNFRFFDDLIGLYRNANSFFLGNTTPGSLGGGAPPTAILGSGAIASPQTLISALALVPVGLTAIAVFPPYSTPRTVPAVSVIFAENPNIR